MTSCFLCNELIVSVNTYINHLRVEHSQNYKSLEFICTFKGCNRSFNLVESFRGHLKKHFSDFHNQTENHVASANNSDNEAIVSLRDTNSNTSYDLGASNVNVNFRYDFLKLALKLLCDETLARSKAFSILKLFYNQFKNFAGNFKTEFKKKLNERNIDSEFIESIFELFENTVHENMLQSEYNIFKELESLGYYITPERRILKSSNEISYKNNHEVLKTSIVHTEMIPLRSVFEKLFNIPEFTEEIINNIQLLKNDEACNIFKSQLWREKLNLLETIEKSVLYVPLDMYIDDFEPLNALGAHSGAYKIGAVYIQIACLPESMQSKLDYIFLLMLYFSEDRKEFGNSRIFRPIIDELNHLQGIGVEIDHKELKRVKFILLGLLGDNLGINAALGFTECFVANHYCRFCKCHKTFMEIIVKEDVSMMRTIENYNLDLLIDDVSLTGVKEKCVFNDIENFHAVDNNSVDVMHDMLEGVCHYNFSEALNYFVTVKKYFSLDLLNERISNYNFGHSTKNKPGLVNQQMLTKKKFKYTAAEMNEFSFNFNILIGDMVPQEDEIWHFVIVFRKVFDIVMSNSCNEDTPLLLSNLIEEHHTLYKKYFGHLKPKHHLMVHYPSLIAKIGPLRRIWTMRFEAKHRFFKKISNTINCRKNMLHSFAVKQQLNVANLLINFEKESTYEEGIKQIIDKQNVSSKYNIQINEDDICYELSWMMRKKIKFKINDVVKHDEFNDGIPCFAIIKVIIKKNSSYIFCLQNLADKGFSTHFQAFDVIPIDNFFSIDIENIEFQRTFCIHKISNMSLINFGT